VPMFGYKNHLGIDRTYGFIRRFIVTHAARTAAVSIPSTRFDSLIDAIAWLCGHRFLAKAPMDAWFRDLRCWREDETLLLSLPLHAGAREAPDH
jgi:hypothetical protein